MRVLCLYQGGRIGKFNKNSEKNIVNIITDKKAKKIFGIIEGHLIDTSQNIKLLTEVANNKKYVLGNDKFGNTWSAKLLNSGEQIWVQARNGQVINGGINKEPRIFNSETGLSSPKRPNWK